MSNNSDLHRAKKPSKRALWTQKSREFRGANPRCAVCGCTDHLQVHHILSKRFYPEYYFDDTNLITLCAKHHTFGKLSAHKNGIWFSEFLKKNFPEKYLAALKRIEI